MITPTQPNFNLVNTAEYREAYANSVQVRGAFHSPFSMATGRKRSAGIICEGKHNFQSKQCVIALTRRIPQSADVT